MFGAFQVGPFQKFPAFQQEEEEGQGGASPLFIRLRRRRDDDGEILAVIAAFIQSQGE